ncbi:hypothetical protein ABW21_db0203521 [Orbilia brochopaga]|nr:hypothetical protein ABW21_db0203521 [Drechslerella brochopaga]
MAPASHQELSCQESGNRPSDYTCRASIQQVDEYVTQEQGVGENQGRLVPRNRSWIADMFYSSPGQTRQVDTQATAGITHYFDIRSFPKQKPVSTSKCRVSFARDLNFQPTAG